MPGIKIDDLEVFNGVQEEQVWPRVVWKRKWAVRYCYKISKLYIIYRDIRSQK